MRFYFCYCVFTSGILTVTRHFRSFYSHLCQSYNFFPRKLMYKVIVLLHIARHSRKSSSHKVWLKLKKEAWKLHRGETLAQSSRLNILVYLRKGDFPCEREEKRIWSFFLLASRLATEMQFSLFSCKNITDLSSLVMTSSVVPLMHEKP